MIIAVSPFLQPQGTRMQRSHRSNDLVMRSFIPPENMFNEFGHYLVPIFGINVVSEE